MVYKTPPRGRLTISGSWPMSSVYYVYPHDCISENNKYCLNQNPPIPIENLPGSGCSGASPPDAAAPPRPGGPSNTGNQKVDHK